MTTWIKASRLKEGMTISFTDDEINHGVSHHVMVVTSVMAYADIVDVEGWQKHDAVGDYFISFHYQDDVKVLDDGKDGYC
jgi:hypothetical protein